MWTVGLLQAADGVQLRDGGDGGAGPGLLPVEQRGERAVLRVRVVQGGGAGERAEGLAQAVGAERGGGGSPDRRLLRRLLRLPQHQEGRIRLPLRPQPHDQSPTQMGLLLVNLT